MFELCGSHSKFTSMTKWLISYVYIIKEGPLGSREPYRINFDKVVLITATTAASFQQLPERSDEHMDSPLIITEVPENVSTAQGNALWASELLDLTKED